MTAPAIDTASIEHLDHRPACEVDDCDREATWAVIVHECARNDFVTGLLCEPCLLEARAEYDATLPCECMCGKTWTSWRDMCLREERIR